MRISIVLVAGLLVLGVLLASDFGASVLSSSSDNSYIVYVYNVDDVAVVYVNDREIGRVSKMKSAQFNITPHLVVGSNRIRMTVENSEGRYSYGFDVTKDGEVIHTFRCGVGMGPECPKESKTGIVFDRTVTIDYKPSAVQANATSNLAGGTSKYDRSIANKAMANYNSGPNSSWMTDSLANSAANSAVNSIANMATNVAQVPWRGGIPNLVPKVINEESEERKFSISARYPQIPAEPTGDDFNYEAARIVKDEIYHFKNGLLVDPDGPTEELVITYKTDFVDRRVISVVFSVAEGSSEDRPIVFSQNLNFDLREQRKLELADLFREDTNHLAILSDYCMQSLKDKIRDAEILRKGAGPSELNYLGWSVTRTGLQIEFYKFDPPSPSEGPPVVLVPFSILKPIVRPGGAISHLIK